ncbi:fumarylacetoacetate hydrolase family protein [Acidocella aminolytica]|uniref:Fumarylacetoacetate hydrolase n=1 Tax=Acidocella aminolytica 101 = DSM 11237 TaxID=1120923 RepID=A0A0D6PEE8_9PROT|nr:fumarylacetoacetate hydrolase family protein [Acidocella aminolytica]GAN79229.1 fumarylacetoacetate hydrolase [Acidocella aminolytica 101 = DSM 11237]GBQ33003.1 2-keto-4-pentenoate hydratase [Acidocella aminolytica 101 = DSM 11237]SHF51237.1 fumarylacetoacetate (FAA) hydrolase [Acidocella aminolytica 101 = DSM 11237]
MKFASLKTSSRDGALLLVSRDLSHAVSAAGIVPTLQSLLENWDEFSPRLEDLYQALSAGKAPGAFAFDPAAVTAPLPRAHQFVDASAFLNHGDIMERAFNLTVKKTPGIAVLVQRQGDEFRGPRDDYPFPTEEDQCDFEGEFAVITGDIGMGSTPEEAESQIRLVTILNDVSMRKHLFRELSMGFGFINAKPASVFGPVAVTPDELGDAWANGRVELDMRVSRNGEWFGHPNGREMDWSFGELLAHLAYNRNLKAGTILGSGTVSNRGYEQVGSACLAERRAVETIAHGKALTDFVHFGETLRFEVKNADGASIFGAIEHRFVKAD